MAIKSKSELNSPKTMIVEKTKQVPIIRVLPDNMPLIYSDGLLIGNNEGVFILSFLQTRFPLAVTPEEVEAIQQVDSYCVARILLTPEQMERSIKAMTDNFQKFVDKSNQSNKEDK